MKVITDAMGQLKRCPIQILWSKSYKYARKYWLLTHFQANSFYGLLDVESIQSPMFNGKHLQLPYFPGHCYAAVKTKDSNQVIFVVFFQRSKILNIQGPNHDSSKRKTTKSDLPYSQFSCSGPKGIPENIIPNIHIVL